MSTDLGTAAESSRRDMPAAESEGRGQVLPDHDAIAEAFGLPLPIYIPRRYNPSHSIGTFSGHLAFAHDLVVASRPELIVELGTHWGESYFTFCQTVQEHKLASLCYAVDRWAGHNYPGLGGEDVYQDVQEYNERFYSQFSYLFRTDFDSALPKFTDSSIGLLHIGRMYTYEAANHAFRTWLPKLKPGGMIMLRDICARHQNFGVWRLWEQIRREFPETFEFHHGWGLGLMRLPGEPASARLLNCMFESEPAVREELRRRYIVYASHLEHVLLRPSDTPVPQAPPATLPAVVVQVFPFGPTGHSEETSLLRNTKPGVWDTLVFELPAGAEQGPLRIDPTTEPGLLEISEIVVQSRDSGETLWRTSDATGLQAAGDAVLIPVPEGLFLLSTGNDAQLALAPPNFDGPLNVTISLMFTPLPNSAVQILSRLAEATNREHEQILRERRDALAQLKDAQQLLRSFEQKLHEEHSVRIGMQESLSWKITDPLRRAMGALRSKSQAKTTGKDM